MEQVLRVATWTAAGILAAGLTLGLAGVNGASYAMHLGLWLLISTPIVRVLMALAAYVRDRDVTFVALTLVVFACLAIPLARYFLSLPR
jgi:uncharacterized membrane protein